jgi:hypothetical protein
MMADKDVGSLVVLDGSKIVGVVTERHYARNVFLKGARRHRRESTTSWNVTSVIWSRACDREFVIEQQLEHYIRGSAP